MKWTWLAPDAEQMAVENVTFNEANMRSRIIISYIVNLSNMHSHNEQLNRRSQLLDDVVHSHQLLPFVHQLVQFVGQLGVSEELCTDTHRTPSTFSTSPSKCSMNVKHARKYCEFVTFTGGEGWWSTISGLRDGLGLGLVTSEPCKTNFKVAVHLRQFFQQCCNAIPDCSDIF